MVATKIHEVVGKGFEWASGSPTAVSTAEQNVGATSTQSAKSSASPASSSYWDYASNTMQQAAESVSDAISAIPIWKSDSTIDATGPGSILDNMPEPQSLDDEGGFMSPRRGGKALAYPDLFTMFNTNPYIGVRGGRHNHPRRHQSMTAVRNLLNLVPLDTIEPTENPVTNSSSADIFDPNSDDSIEVSTHSDSARGGGSSGGRRSKLAAFASSSSSPSETASQLAEGTIRAYRDIALDEAVLLHEALRFWSYRWERPLLSWLEAGPTVWFSKAGYRHDVVGEKVSQIQAVLARRCTSIGDLQQHLLRAGWQRGVAQWGVLGDGGEWAPVAGFDGSMGQAQSQDERDSPPKAQGIQRESSELFDMRLPPPSSGDATLGEAAPSSYVSSLPQRSQPLYYANIFVKKNHGGKIFMDNPALVEWSVHAMAVVRQQLYRAANGKVILPFAENWAAGDDESLDYGGVDGLLIDSDDQVTFPPESPSLTGNSSKLPIWASLSISPLNLYDPENSVQRSKQGLSHRMIISDLNLMVSEVSSLLDIMEDVMQLQRNRRLEKLKAPTWLRQNWYLASLTIPSIAYITYKMAKNGIGIVFLKYAANKIAEFFHEHVSDPVCEIFNELFVKGNKNISDREARNDTIVNLKMMIREWLNDNYPDMPLAERKIMVESMDMSLIDSKKAESLSTIYEINNVIRMSFIEAQFIKKEMMNALLALDEMRASNNINMNLAAVTPSFLAGYVVKQLFQFVFYATFKLGKSRDETYSSFRNVLIEIERLLVMRDNPPSPPVFSEVECSTLGRINENYVARPPVSAVENVLNTDDLGMLMLHIHELRTIMWRDRRRFSLSEIRSVGEDLSELAGERGAVSVRQQLQIISRIFRTYTFLKSAKSSRRLFQ